MTKPLISLDDLRRILSYDPLTGLFHWVAPTNYHHKAGDIAGTNGKHDKNHMAISIHGKRYKAHRLAWFYVYGRWPDGQIDHKDLDGMNNRIDNLREATNDQNCANRRVFGKSGLKGVVYNARWGKRGWRAQITHNKRSILLGYFTSAEEAHAAYADAAKRLHGQFARAA